ncbi:hypothetical protein Hypma_003774 [Hypsizygus marmoreus]|uniref:Uncharacterized protein n=1 Tax=Hypsizygus marmoreus TaxID=39966 RepID=A0A369K4M9_HYPMA|nr:hypothetical protein Hypma_003774 [Hypsizygus marmoreus]
MHRLSPRKGVGVRYIYAQRMYFQCSIVLVCGLHRIPVLIHALYAPLIHVAHLADRWSPMWPIIRPTAPSIFRHVVDVQLFVPLAFHMVSTTIPSLKI